MQRRKMRWERIARLSDKHVEELVALYQDEWWTKGRRLADVRNLLEHSGVIVAFCDTRSRKLMAFARVLTDYVFKALVLDVIVATEHRGAGLGRALMEAVITHPKLKRVRHFELYCLPELVPLYRKWGFTEKLGKLRFMRRARKRRHPAGLRFMKAPGGLKSAPTES